MLLQPKNLVEKLSLSDITVGLGGCKSHDISLDCCEYDITIFDDEVGSELRVIDDTLVQIHHGRIDETDLEILQKYDSMKILSDPSWKLLTFLSKIKEKQEKIRNSVAKNFLIEAAFFATKAKQNIEDDFAPVWIKCSAYLICDSLVLLNSKYCSPAHMLETIRGLEKNQRNQYFSHLMEILGLERTTPSLLERMMKSTIGFSDMMKNNSDGQIIRKKYDYLKSHSLLSDCYFYLGTLNKNIILEIKDSIHKNPELIHVLKTAFDLENDKIKLQSQSVLLNKIVNELIHIQNHA